MQPRVTIVTGPPRSGTSCAMALLAACGLSPGANVDLEPSPHNPSGHFESPLLLSINRRILSDAGGRGSMLRVPDEGRVADSALRHLGFLDLFARRFDGEVVKDPAFCLTLPFWEESWPAVDRIVFCLRHPVAVAASISRRYPRLRPIDALRLWRVYTERFLALPRRSAAVVFDFDAFQADPRHRLEQLLTDLGLSVERADVALKRVYLPGSVHHREAEEALPQPVAALYERLRGARIVPPSVTPRAG